MKNNLSKDISFSNLKRRKRIEAVSGVEFDLIIIGGGVTGAGIALDAALRGLRTLVVEKGDFASGTSSKSTKLIHGGLRYLKQFEIGLVKESGLERAVAHKNIPHLVHPEKMLLPIVDEGAFGKLSASFAISVYDWLASVPSDDRKVTFDKEETFVQEPLLNRKLLRSSIQYSEYRTDDARLTIELVKAARREKAEAFNYMEVEDFVYDGGKVCGVKCIDKISKNRIEFRSKRVVSAAGPWVDLLRDINKSKDGKTLQLTKGVHVVVPKEKLPVKSAIYFDAFDGRLLFAIPRGKVTYIGTSDTKYEGDMDKVLCSKDDASYILKAVNNMFEIPELKVNDIVSTWAGLRPLIHEEGKSPSELSRKDEIFVSETNLISIAGGKLTGYRKMAEKIVDLVQKELNKNPDKECDTEHYNIHSDGFNNYDEFEVYQDQLSQKHKEHEVSEFNIWYLTSTYGKHAEMIIDEALKSELELKKALIRWEIRYAIEFESCFYPDDYFNRRSGKLYFDIESITANFDFIIDEFQTYYNWSTTELDLIKSKSMMFIKDVTVIKD